MTSMEVGGRDGNNGENGGGKCKGPQEIQHSIFLKYMNLK